MAKTLRVRQKIGWITKPPEDIPVNRLTSEEVDDNFLYLESEVDNRVMKFASVTEMEQSNDRNISVGLSCITDGNTWKVTSNPTLPPNGVTVVSSAILGLYFERVGGVISAPANNLITSHPQSVACFEIKVPSEMPTVSDAISYLSKFETADSTMVDIYQESGFQFKEQVFINARNLGWVTVFAEDAETIIDGDYLTKNRTQDIYGVITRAAYTVVQGGQGPRIGCIYRMINGGVMYDKPTGRKMGLFVSGPGSGCNVMNYRGFRNCGDAGVYANRGAYVNCYGCDVSGSGVGVYVNRATADCQNVNAQNCVTDGILGLYGATITAVGANVSGSVGGIRGQYGSNIIFRDGIADDVTGVAISAQNNSRIEAEAATANRATERGVYAHSGSTITFSNGVADECTEYGIHADGGSIIDATSASAKNCGVVGIRATSGSVINAFGSNTDGSARGYAAEFSSKISASSSSAIGGGVFSSQNSEIYFLAGVATGVTGKPALEAYSGSSIAANGVDVSGTSGPNGKAVYANTNSRIDFTNGIANDCYDGIHAKSGSTITAPLAKVLRTTGAASSGVYAEQASTIDFASGKADDGTYHGIRSNTGSVVNCSNATAEGCGGSGLRVDGGSHINANLAKFRKVAGEDNTQDMAIFGGSIVNAASSEGGSNLANRVISLNGILFRL